MAVIFSCQCGMEVDYWDREWVEERRSENVHPAGLVVRG